MKLKTSQLPKQKKGVCTENLLGFLILISNKISTVADFTFLNCFSISLFRCLFISLFHCFSISRLFHSQIDSRHLSAKKPPRAKLFSTERGSSSGSHFLSTCSVSARRKRFWLKRGTFEEIEGGCKAKELAHAGISGGDRTVARCLSTLGILGLLLNSRNARVAFFLGCLLPLSQHWDFLQWMLTVVDPQCRSTCICWSSDFTTLVHQPISPTAIQSTLYTIKQSRKDTAT